VPFKVDDFYPGETPAVLAVSWNKGDPQKDHIVNKSFTSLMVRRIASQVHKQASHLTHSGFTKTLPVWYQAILDHPPLPLPPQEPPSWTSYDSKPPKQALTATPKKGTGASLFITCQLCRK
jgi:Mitochondrial ribosomal protein S25